jgi:hypothetical protein
MLYLLYGPIFTMVVIRGQRPCKKKTDAKLESNREEVTTIQER